MDTCFLHGFLKAPLLIAQAKNPTISAETRRPLAAMIFGSDVSNFVHSGLQLLKSPKVKLVPVTATHESLPIGPTEKPKVTHHVVTIVIANPNCTLQSVILMYKKYLFSIGRNCFRFIFCVEAGSLLVLCCFRFTLCCVEAPYLCCDVFASPCAA